MNGVALFGRALPHIFHDARRHTQTHTLHMSYFIHYLDAKMNWAYFIKRYRANDSNLNSKNKKIHQIPTLPTNQMENKFISSSLSAILIYSNWNTFNFIYFSGVKIFAIEFHLEIPLNGCARLENQHWTEFFNWIWVNQICFSKCCSLASHRQKNWLWTTKRTSNRRKLQHAEYC